MLLGPEPDAHRAWVSLLREAYRSKHAAAATAPPPAGGPGGGPPARHRRRPEDDGAGRPPKHHAGEVLAWCLGATAAAAAAAGMPLRCPRCRAEEEGQRYIGPHWADRDCDAAPEDRAAPEEITRIHY